MPSSIHSFRFALCGFAVASLASVGACDRAIEMAGPTPLPNPSPPTIQTTIGITVVRPGGAPLEGARVEFGDGPQKGAACTTNDQGFCALTWTGSNAPSPEIVISKEGFFPETLLLPTGVHGSWVVLTPTSTPQLSGEYQVTISPDRGCVDFAERFRVISSAATIYQTKYWLQILTAAPQRTCPHLIGGLYDAAAIDLFAEPDCRFPEPNLDVGLASLSDGGVVTGSGKWTGQWQPPVLRITLDGVLEISSQSDRLHSCRAAGHEIVLHAK